MKINIHIYFKIASTGNIFKKNDILQYKIINESTYFISKKILIKYKAKSFSYLLIYKILYF